MIKIVIICVVTTIYAGDYACAGQSDVVGVIDHVCNTEHQNREEENDGSTSIWRSLLSFPITIYRRYITNLDKPTCVFSPSCSDYSKQAICSHGVIQGLLLTADRLTRCHGYSLGKYTLDDEKKLIDPVEDSVLW